MIAVVEGGVVELRGRLIIAEGPPNAVTIVLYAIVTFVLYVVLAVAGGTPVAIELAYSCSEATIAAVYVVTSLSCAEVKIVSNNQYLNLAELTPTL